MCSFCHNHWLTVKTLITQPQFLSIQEIVGLQFLTMLSSTFRYKTFVTPLQLLLAENELGIRTHCYQNKLFTFPHLLNSSNRKSDLLIVINFQLVWGLRHLIWHLSCVGCYSCCLGVGVGLLLDDWFLFLIADLLRCKC